MYGLRDDGRVGAFALGRAVAAASFAYPLLVAALAGTSTLMASESDKRHHVHRPAAARGLSGRAGNGPSPAWRPPAPG